MRSLPGAGAGTGLALLVALGLLSGPAAAAPAGARAPLDRPALSRVAADLSPAVLSLALDAAGWARRQGIAAPASVLTVIDYSLPSTAPRLWVLDLERPRLLYRELVAHGAGSGDNFATRFSNTEGSRQTSLGLFLTGDTYEGGNGYSLRLRGLEPGTNDRAYERTIVVHGAWYVSEEHALRWGRLGRSWGCPALPLARARAVIDAIKDGSLLFAYYPDTRWLRTARYAPDAPPRAASAPAALARRRR
jgi:hypothetical protein